MSCSRSSRNCRRAVRIPRASLGLRHWFFAVSHKAFIFFMSWASAQRPCTRFSFWPISASFSPFQLVSACFLGWRAAFTTAIGAAEAQKYKLTLKHGVNPACLALFYALLPPLTAPALIAFPHLILILHVPPKMDPPSSHFLPQTNYNYNRTEQVPGSL